MDPSSITVPPGLAAATAHIGDPARAQWQLNLPQQIVDLADQWELNLGEPFQPGGTAAWVAPATDATGRDAVLKVAWNHAESRDEAAGLATWAGQGAVQVWQQMIDGPTTAMLLERCRPGVELRTQPLTVQHQVIGEVLGRLHAVPLPPEHGFRHLIQMCREWGASAEAGHARAPDLLDAALVREGLALWKELPQTAGDQVLLCTDLHAANVLSGQRAPWLLIDPKPYVGDPHYDVLQHLLNCPEELHTDPVCLVSVVSEAAGLQPERVQQWLFARCVQQSWNWPELAPVAERLSGVVLR